MGTIYLLVGKITPLLNKKKYYFHCPCPKIDEIVDDIQNKNLRVTRIQGGVSMLQVNNS